MTALCGVAGTNRDNADVSELAVEAAPRRGRVWVILGFALALGALGYSAVSISTQEPESEVVRVAGISDSQRLFAGVPQEGEPLPGPPAPPAPLRRWEGHA